MNNPNYMYGDFDANDYQHLDQYAGQPINEMSIEELREAVRNLGNLYNQSLEQSLHRK